MPAPPHSSARINKSKNIHLPRLPWDYETQTGSIYDFVQRLNMSCCIQTRTFPMCLAHYQSRIINQPSRFAVMFVHADLILSSFRSCDPICFLFSVLIEQVDFALNSLQAPRDRCSRGIRVFRYLYSQLFCYVHFGLNSDQASFFLLFLFPPLKC